MSHTPGPWKVFYATNGNLLGIGEETGEGVTDGQFGLWRDGPERDANARLIAAAPDLLATLKAVVAISMRKTDVWDAALAAIAKAEARQP